MPDNNFLPGNLHVGGALSVGVLNIPAQTITDAAVNAGAAIGATKLIHQFPIALPLAGTVTAFSRLVHIARAAGTIVALEATVVTPATGADRTITIDLLKGSQASAFATVLTSTIGFTNTTLAREVKSAVVNTTLAALADGDILQITGAVAGAAGAQAAELIVTLTLREAPQ